MAIFMHLYKTMHILKRNYKKMNTQKWLKSNLDWVECWVALILWQRGWASKGAWLSSCKDQGHPRMKWHCEGTWAVCSRLGEGKWRWGSHLNFGQSARTGESFNRRTEIWELMEQEIRSHCGQRVRTGITEESVNAGEYKAGCRC